MACSRNVASAREIAVLIACDRVLRRWPVHARIAFREAVVANVENFSSGAWDPVEVQIRAEIFFARWQRGLPWPPGPDDLAPAPRAAITYDREAVAALAGRIRALGLPLARTSR